MIVVVCEWDNIAYIVVDVNSGALHQICRIIHHKCRICKKCTTAKIMFGFSKVKSDTPRNFQSSSTSLKTFLATKSVHQTFKRKCSN